MTIVPLSEENVQLFSQTAAKILPEAWSFETYKNSFQTLTIYRFLPLVMAKPQALNNIGVLEKFRRMGIAKALFDSAYNAAKAEKWYLEVRESNLGAISFYEKLGFERVGMRKNFYTAPTENAVLMALQPTENGEINDI